MKKSLLIFGIVAAMLVVLSPVQVAAAGVSCHAINATGAGQDLGGGNTTAQVSDGGLLQGTTAGSFSISGAPPIFGIAGTVTFTTNKGTLTAGIAGTINVLTGDFAAAGPVTGATGKLAGATGSLSFAGNENLGTGSFTETITGSICVELSS